MSVLIKGMEMPNNCGACPLRLAWCIERIYMVKRPERCPLVPVPPHGRLMFIGEQCLYSWDEIEDAIDATETIIPAEEE